MQFLFEHRVATREQIGSSFFQEHTHSHPYHDGENASTADYNFKSTVESRINLFKNSPGLYYMRIITTTNKITKEIILKKD